MREAGGDADGDGSNGYNIHIVGYDSSHTQVGYYNLHISNSDSSYHLIDLTSISSFTNITDLQVSAEAIVSVKNLVPAAN